MRAGRNQFRSLLLPKSRDYLNWLHDELELISNLQDKQDVKNLFDSSLKDHPVSTDLWLEYLKFCEFNPEICSDLNLEYRKAAAFVAWDLKRGHLLNTKSINRAIPYTSQAKREANLDDISPSPFESFELTFPNNLLEYIDAVKSCKLVNLSDKLTLCRVLFERALELNCSNFKIWEDYLKYLRSEMSVSTIILGVNDRLIRAHPLNPISWTLLIENLELFNKFAEIENVWNNLIPRRLLNSSHETFLTLQLTHLDSLRRQNVETETLILAFQTAIQEEELQFGRHNEATDPHGRLQRYFAQFLHFIGRFDRFHDVWKQLLKQHAKEAAFWLEYLQFERALIHRGGSIESVTTVFKRAAVAVTDYPETIFYEWIQFERKDGLSIKALLEAQERIEKQRQILKERDQQRKKREEAQNSNKRTRVESESSIRKAVVVSNVPVPISVPVVKSSFNPDATLFVNNLPFNFLEKDIKNHFNNLIQSVLSPPSDWIKSIRMHMKLSNFKGHATIEFDSPETAILVLEKFNRNPADESGRPVFLTKYISPVEKTKKPPLPLNKSESDAKTLYISNLPIKESIRVEELFKNIPGIQQIRHVEGKHFCFIEFETELFACDGLKFISESETDKKIKAAFSKPPINNTTTTLLKPRSVAVKK